MLERLQRSETAPPAVLHGAKQGWVLRSLQNAFFHLRNTASTEEAIVQTVAGGGDTDTNAAICGALVGAAHGREAIPAAWRRLVLTCRPLAASGARHPRPRGLWPVDALSLAERLLVL